MRAHRRCLRGGTGSEPQYFLRDSRAVRVMCEPGGRDAGSPRKDGEDFRMQTLQSWLRKRVLKRSPRQLMPKREGAILVSHHADAEAPLYARFIWAAGVLQQPDFRPAGDHANKL